MARWPEWFRKVGDTAAHPGALDAGKKLLGYLATRRETPGVETLVRRITLNDGTIVEASFNGDQPAVVVYAPDGTENCELYVESGMLDLGPNIASDAGNRFNPGPPAFDDSYATLLFGDGVDCRKGVPGLNGRVRIDTHKRTVRSECLPKAGTSVRSRLRDPAKKKAQAMLPASCWSGLMQRYVQAVYGGVALKYTGSTTALTVEGVSFGVADNWGLLNLGGTLRFVRIDEAGVATLYAVRPKGECFSAVLSLWRSMPDRNDQERAERSKVLSIALSGCVPGKSTGTIEGLPTGNRHFTRRSAWVFDHDGTRAVAVLERDGMATCYAVTFKPNAGTPIASVEVVKVGKAGAIDGVLPVSCSSPFEAAIDNSGFTLETAQRECNYDFPVYAYFNGTGIEVVNYALIAQRAVASSTPRCVIEQLYDLTADFGIPILTATNDTNQILNAINEVCIVAEGYYAPSWSSVDKQACFIDDAGNLKTSATGEVHGVASPLTLRSVSRDISADAVDYIGWQCYWDGCDVFAAYPQTLFSEPKTCGFKRSATVDTSSEVTYGGVTAGGAVNFAPAKGSLFVADCNTFIFSPSTVESNISGTFTLTDFDVFGFEGQATAMIASIASLAWGSCSAVVSERHAVNGGKGFYYREAKTHEWGIASASGTITYRAEIYTAWPTRPGLFCKTLGELAALGWTLDDHTTAFDDRDETISTPGPVNQVGEAYVMGVLRRRPPGFTNTVMRAKESYRAVGSWGDTVNVSANIAIKASDGSPSADYTQGNWELSDVGIEAVHAVGLAFDDPATGDAITEETSTGRGAWALKSPTDYVRGYSLVAADGLLGDTIRPQLSVMRGAPIAMDRQVITGGYAKVNTPSFVGWA